MLKLSNVFCKWMAVQRRWDIVKRQTLKIATRYRMLWRAMIINFDIDFIQFIPGSLYSICHTSRNMLVQQLGIYFYFMEISPEVSSRCLSLSLVVPLISPAMTGINRDLKWHVFRISMFYIYLFSHASWQINSDLMAKWN